MLDSMEIDKWAEQAGLLAAAADPLRLRVLTILSSQQRCVCDLQEAVSVPLNLLSYHLRALREAGLVVCTKRGRRREYRLAPGAFERLHAALPNAGHRPAEQSTTAVAGRLAAAGAGLLPPANS